MEVEIKITIQVNQDKFEKEFAKWELISDIKGGFEEMTGYKIDEIDVVTNE